MKVFRSCSHDPIVFIEGNNFSSHLVIRSLFAVTATSAAATVITDRPGVLPALCALFVFFVFNERHLLLLSALDVGLALVLLGHVVAYEFS